MMTLETKNQILALSRVGKTLRKIAPIVGYSIAKLSCFLRDHNPLIVDHIEACANCRKEWDVKILQRGFKKQFSARNVDKSTTTKQSLERRLDVSVSTAEKSSSFTLIRKLDSAVNPVLKDIKTSNDKC